MTVLWRNSNSCWFQLWLGCCPRGELQSGCSGNCVTTLTPRHMGVCYPGNRRMAGAEWQAVLILSPVNPRGSPPFLLISIGIGDPIKTVRFPAHLSLLPPWLHSFFFQISLLDTSEAKRDTNWTRALNKCCNGSPYKYKAVFSLGFIAIM